MAKIGPIFSIIFPATSTDVHPAVFLQFPLYLKFDPSLYLYTYSLLAFGSSSKIKKTYFGFEVGKIDTKVLTFKLL